ncbi:MAG: HAMP domain-containing protein, partial [Acetobacteraceae bacterium]|nr:HAMP domain-containing protein [Acetobacteraceae bacterium]
DGNRHVRAALLDRNGAIAAESRLVRPAAETPGWFRRLIAPELAPVEISAGSGPSRRFLMRLWANPTNEVGEVWGEFRDFATVLAVFCLLASLLVFWTVGRTLRPLDRLRSGLSSVGAGDYAARVAAHGPPELAALAHGFNSMAARLAEAQLRNARLNEQLMTLQEEERADLARDLHDEIGPSLFAVNVTAATIQQLAAAGRTSEIPGQVRAIQDVVGHVQRYVKAILGRLRPVHAVELGLQPAVEALAAFWRARYPAIAFDLDISTDEADLDDATKEVIYRVVQEGLANAVRHGKPGRIGVAVRTRSGMILAEVTDNGTVTDALAEPGFGLSGMRERVSARDGTLAIRRGAAGSGWTILASLPLPARSCEIDA